MRVFLKNESQRLAAMAAGASEAEFGWITDQGERIVSEALHPEAESVALFAGGAPALRETIPLAAAVPDTFAVADTPRLRPLLTALAETPRALVVFVDGERARLITLSEDGSTDEVSPAVVVIRATGRDVSGSGEVRFIEIGSGVLISQDGKVMTAAHVVHAMDEIRVEFMGGEIVAARVVSSEPTADLSLLKLDRVPPGTLVSENG